MNLNELETTSTSAPQLSLTERVAGSAAFRAALGAAMLLVALSMTLTPLRSTNDAWWHLKSGKVLVERGLRLPENDLFTWTGEQTAWHNHEWLAQVLFWGAYRAAEAMGADGLLGLTGGRALVIVAAFMIVLLMIRREGAGWGWTALAMLVLLAVARRTLYPRPPVFSYVFQAAFMMLLIAWGPQLEGVWRDGVECAARRRRQIAALIVMPALMVVWANLHGGFLIGIVIIGLYGAAEAALWMWNRWGAKLAGREGDEVRAAAHFRNGLWTAALLGLCVVASLMTPYGYHLYELPARVMGNERLVRAIGELHSPDFYFTRGFEFILLMTPLGLALVRRKSPPMFYLLLWVFFGHQALQHVRHLPVFAIAVAPLLGWIGAGIRAGMTREQVLATTNKGGAALLEVACAVAFVALAIFFLTDRREGGRSFIDRNAALLAQGEVFEEHGYPKAACDFIILNEFHGRMFNQINNAGYLIWRLSPEHHKVFTDSRFDIWGDAYVWDADAIKDGGASVKQGTDGEWTRTAWWELLDRYEINFIVIGGSEGLNPALAERGGWAIVFSGGAWNERLRQMGQSGAARVGEDNIWVRDTAENAALIARARKSFMGMTGIELAAHAQ